METEADWQIKADPDHWFGDDGRFIEDKTLDAAPIDLHRLTMHQRGIDRRAAVGVLIDHHVDAAAGRRPVDRDADGIQGNRKPRGVRRKVEAVDDQRRFIVDEEDRVFAAAVVSQDDVPGRAGIGPQQQDSHQRDDGEKEDDLE